MILQPATKQDFDFRGEIQVDIENKGFTKEEMETFAPPVSMEPGARSLSDLLNKLWKKNRQAPPEMRNLKSKVGYQEKPLLIDLISTAKARKIKLDPIIESKVKNYNFYIMRCGIYIAPDGDEKFEALKFEVHYKDGGASTYTMLPGPQTDTILKLGGKADMGLNVKGEFGFPEISFGTGSLEASAKAKLESEFIVSFHYELKTQTVDSFGKGTSCCTWFMHKGDMLRNDVVFYPVITTPKAVTRFECEFKASFKINHPRWKNAELYRKRSKMISVSA
jgi:hypothetical protein